MHLLANLKEARHGVNCKLLAIRMEGWHGWDDYAAYYDWENAQTVGRRDLAFWSVFAQGATAGPAGGGGPILELGCGTGRVALPVARAGATVVGIDRSAPMLDRARKRVKRARLQSQVQLVRGDIRYLPFPDKSFPLVMAPYGILQSLLVERDLTKTLAAVSRVLTKKGTFGMELVADLPAWDEYSKRVSMRGKRGPNGKPITLVESVTQDRVRQITRFEQEFIEGRGKSAVRKKFGLAFRTLTVPQMVRRLEKAGLKVSALLGDYQGGVWGLRAEVWIILARRG
ncbi:MAG: class I SAM-dependent methyltransferase [Acidobacteria bacterium]|nr:class I SAM-dependent methyltransferase [Acidobacteriota bacterium]MSO62587.1 class I SAM-dependent methyltransferase [Acidobacteriota bacterium]